MSDTNLHEIQFSGTLSLDVGIYCASEHEGVSDEEQELIDWLLDICSDWERLHKNLPQWPNMSWRCTQTQIFGRPTTTTTTVLYLLSDDCAEPTMQEFVCGTGARARIELYVEHWCVLGIIVSNVFEHSFQKSLIEAQQGTEAADFSLGE